MWLILLLLPFNSFANLEYTMFKLLPVFSVNWVYDLIKFLFVLLLLWDSLKLFGCLILILLLILFCEVMNSVDLLGLWQGVLFVKILFIFEFWKL